MTLEWLAPTMTAVVGVAGIAATMSLGLYQRKDDRHRRDQEAREHVSSEFRRERTEVFVDLLKTAEEMRRIAIHIDKNRSEELDKFADKWATLSVECNKVVARIVLIAEFRTSNAVVVYVNAMNEWVEKGVVGEGARHPLLLHRTMLMKMRYEVNPLASDQERDVVESLL